MTDTAPPETMRAWRVHEYGQPTAVMQLEEIAVPTPNAGEVLIECHAIPLNLNDLERVTGGNMMMAPEFPYSPGMEAMGVVVAAGEGAEHLAGTRVTASTAMAIGGFAEFAIASAAATFEMPDDIALPDAAAVFFPFHLAWLGLFDRADLGEGETVLIHAAAGGSGSAAVQLAKQAGARVIATAGSAEKLELCTTLGADVVIDYTAEGLDLTAEVLAATDGRGVDVVFDNVGAAVFEASLKALAYNGRYLMMGFASDKTVADDPFLVPRQLSLSNARLCGVMLNYQSDAMVEMIKGAMGWNVLTTSTGQTIQAELVDMLRSGAIRTVIGRQVPFEQLPAALEALGSRETSGRVVVEL
ncbi:MAG: zinc-binding dehydrogenase [Actinomycetota bacterium]